MFPSHTAAAMTMTLPKIKQEMNISKMSSHSGSNLQKQTFQRFIPFKYDNMISHSKGYELKFKLYLFDSRWNHQKFTVQIESDWLKENLCKESHC